MYGAGFDVEREQLMAAREPRDLFGDAVEDARALRRAYAQLAKRFRADDDAEAFQHLRQLYERARAEPTPSEDVASRSPGEVVADALQSGNLQGIFDGVIAHHTALLDDSQGLLLEAIRVLILYAGPGLGPGALDMLQSVLESPRWTLDPREIDRWARSLGDLRTLKAAAADERLPAALVAGMRGIWAEGPAAIGKPWLEAATSLREQPLHPRLRSEIRFTAYDGTESRCEGSRRDLLDEAFAILEADYPAALYVIAEAEDRLLRAVRGAPHDITDERLAALRRAYPPSSTFAEEWGEVLWAKMDSVPVRFGLTLLIAALLIFFVGPVVALGLAYLVRVFVVKRLFRQVFKRRFRDSWVHHHRGDTAELLALASEHGVFPRELPALILGQPPDRVDANAFEEGHPLLVLDKDPTAILRTLNQAHLDRLAAAMDAARA